MYICTRFCLFVPLGYVYSPSPSTHKAFGLEGSWGIRFMIVCVVDPIRYSSDMNILAVCTYDGRAVKSSTVVPPNSRFGEASLPVRTS